jgi:hypothetical protein
MLAQRWGRKELRCFMKSYEATIPSLPPQWWDFLQFAMLNQWLNACLLQARPSRQIVINS